MAERSEAPRTSIPARDEQFAEHNRKNANFLPIILLSGCMLGGALLYGTRSMLKSRAVGQTHGMMMRVGFQGVALVFLCGAGFYYREPKKDE